MNFVDPKEYDIPGLVRKNRYKTILPSEYLLPQGGKGSGACHLGTPQVQNWVPRDTGQSSKEMGWSPRHPRKGRE